MGPATTNSSHRVGLEPDLNANATATVGAKVVEMPSDEATSVEEAASASTALIASTVSAATDDVAAVHGLGNAARGSGGISGGDGQVTAGGGAEADASLFLPLPMLSAEGNTATLLDSRRSSGRKRGGTASYFAANYEEDSLHMLKADPFAVNPPGSGLPGAQPFGVTVDPLVFAVVDFHSHLLSSEIIGFLGGHWDAEQRQLHLREAFPCRSISSDTGLYMLSSTRLPRSRSAPAIEGRQMKVVGWYHSHQSSRRSHLYATCKTSRTISFSSMTVRSI